MTGKKSTIIALFCLPVALLAVLCILLNAPSVQSAPSGRNCHSVGPFPPDWCGCMWGEVYFAGEPVAGAVVTLTFGGQSITATTQIDELEPDPYYPLSAYGLGARTGDVVTLSVEFAGYTATRVVRGWPDEYGQLYAPLVLSTREWVPWVTGRYTRAVALDGDTVWAGGASGVISISLSSGISVEQSLPWDSTFIRALAADADGHIWASGDDGIAEFDGTTWMSHSIPINPPLRGLAIDHNTGTIWAGNDSGNVIVYNGNWHITGTFNAPVMDLVIDDGGQTWVATWGRGVFRQNGSGGWVGIEDVEGLGVNVLSAATGNGTVWFGMWPFLDGAPRGGVARYDVALDSWRIYTTAHGLPETSEAVPGAPVVVYGLAYDGALMWAGTEAGVSVLGSENGWGMYTDANGLRPGRVTAIATGGGTAVAASPPGLDRLGGAPGNPPTAQIDTVSPITLAPGMTLTLIGSGVDGDEGGARILAWDWSSSLDGPICTLATCALSFELLTPGFHILTLQAQDDEGMWSEPVTSSAEVEWIRIYLPLILCQ